MNVIVLLVLVLSKDPYTFAVLNSHSSMESCIEVAQKISKTNKDKEFACMSVLKIDKYGGKMI